MLDEFRLSFGAPFDAVVERIKQNPGWHPSSRRMKTTQAIRDKLTRESIRLSQMQDIAGCRIVVPSAVKVSEGGALGQDRVVESLRLLFQDATVIDRRERPSHGYRAVHLIVRESGKPIEIQVRSGLQHQWAEFSEKLSERDPAIKYGAGNETARRLLANLSAIHAEHEVLERTLASVTDQFYQVKRRAVEALNEVLEFTGFD